MTADELKAKIDLEGDRKDFTYKEHECRVLRMPITGTSNTDTDASC